MKDSGAGQHPRQGMLPDPGERTNSNPPDVVWPATCAEAAGVVFQLRRRGMPLLPGVTVDTWASSIMSWSTGRTVRCCDLHEIAA